MEGRHGAAASAQPAIQYSTADDLAEAPKLDQHVGAEMVAIWADACFGKFHPDVVVKMGLVAA